MPEVLDLPRLLRCVYPLAPQTLCSRSPVLHGVGGMENSARAPASCRVPASLAFPLGTPGCERILRLRTCLPSSPDLFAQPLPSPQTKRVRKTNSRTHSESSRRPRDLHAAFIRGWPVNGWNRNVIKPQINAELRPVVNAMVHHPGTKARDARHGENILTVIQ
jgi:hypothetical protein